jgi:hypothetical protein
LPFGYLKFGAKNKGYCKILILLATINLKKKSENISEQIEFKKIPTIIGNLALALWISLDTAAFLLVNIAAGAVFLLAALVGVYAALKFLGCMRPCYNCKKCTFGLGRLYALYFGRRSLKDYKKTYGLPVAIFFYALIGPFPAAIALYSTVQAFTNFKALVLVILLALTVFSGLTWRQQKGNAASSNRA